MANMQAWRIHAFGDLETLQRETLERPVPGADEVLVAVKATSINPVDYKTRRGEFPPIETDDLPVILGRDIAGVVEAVGAAADGFAHGQRVYGMPGFERGTYATHVLMKPSELAVLPAHMDMSGAGAVPLAALTAWQGLFDHGGLKTGEHVLIHGAAGGVGHLAIQFAKVRGARVTATGRAADRDFLHGLHADRVIDTDAQDFTDMGADVDLVFDLLGGDVQKKSWQVLKQGGRMISTLEEPDADAAREKGAKAARYMAEPNGSQLAEIADLIAAGRVHVAVDRSFPFAELDAAHRRLEEAHVQGKVIVTIDDEDEG